MVRERYRAALIGLGRIADTIDDEVVGSGWFVPFSHMGSYMDVPRGAGCRWRGPAPPAARVVRRTLGPGPGPPLRKLRGHARTRAPRHRQRLHFGGAHGPRWCSTSPGWCVPAARA